MVFIIMILFKIPSAYKTRESQQEKQQMLNNLVQGVIHSLAHEGGAFTGPYQSYPAVVCETPSIILMI